MESKMIPELSPYFPKDVSYCILDYFKQPVQVGTRILVEVTEKDIRPSIVLQSSSSTVLVHFCRYSKYHDQYVSHKQLIPYQDIAQHNSHHIWGQYNHRIYNKISKIIHKSPLTLDTDANIEHILRQVSTNDEIMSTYWKLRREYDFDSRSVFMSICSIGFYSNISAYINYIIDI